MEGNIGFGKPILNHISKNWDELRVFVFYYRTIFEFGFFFLYTLEQGILIFITATFGTTPTIVSYFSLISTILLIRAH